MLIALGVTGGIGAYKAVEVARGLQKRGHDVAAIMTASAKHFVGEVTFEAITRRPVISDQFARGLNADIQHIALATDISLLIVAPATANVIAKLANGIADDFLTSLFLATRAPVLLAPAMNTHMLEHPAVRANLQTLSARGVHFVDPGEGFLACGWIGKGRLAEPEDIVVAAEALLRPSSGSLIGRRVVVSAGPTYEDIDPVRYIGNRSSGRMGYAIAAEAARRGASVVLVSGPTRLDVPAGVTIERVRSAAEMARAIREHVRGADAVVMAAAVADYTPEHGAADAKLPKSDAPTQISLVRTPDILRELGESRGDAARPVLIGFAAETGDPRARAREKLARKQVDLIVANDVSRQGAGFDVDTNAAVLIDRDGETETPVQPKAVLAATIIDRVERLLSAPTAQPARS
ncbi:MAG TPA: bifunctional phosphopantothenoylcysteine decarboxylase/phosphopantothenate--cysteine ligase CoaBC [Vicinamibacterales bacterium]|jgi:phosphopantothenoylcysteine decarboxylase/phosphopantothenate--cysteine ligase|nr:bifunctional phosphopantothenoylcysteine decarboxylase/phosphopantothenate--cysteine ligase CoaBC [Vicinamibacterales bacterium]